MHLCAELIAASMMLEPHGEVGANFSLQLSSRTQFTKINNKKVFAENQCEKHKKSSLTLNLSIYLPIRLDPRGGRQTGIPEYQVLRGLVETK